MCDESPLRQPGPGERRGPKDRLRVDEMVPLSGQTRGILRTPARATRAEPAPVVLVCPERYGLVQHTVDVVDRFAEAGYVAVSPDFYSDVEIGDPEARLPELADDAVLRHVRAALEGAARVEGADLDRVCVLGVCRSGSWGLLAAAELPAVRSVIALYGAAAKKEWATGERRPTAYDKVLAASTAPVLGIFGERDHTISVDDVRRLRTALEDAGRSYEFVLEQGLPHGWLNPTMPGRFREEAAERTWARMLAFVERTLAAGPAPGEGDLRWRFEAVVSRDYDFASNVRVE